MKKFGTRLISAVLAGCMMTSVLPVSAFALEGSAEFERTVSAQENSDAPAETSGKGYLLPTDSATTINKDFIEEAWRQQGLFHKRYLYRGDRDRR